MCNSNFVLHTTLVSTHVYIQIRPVGRAFKASTSKAKYIALNTTA